MMDSFAMLVAGIFHNRRKKTILYTLPERRKRIGVIASEKRLHEAIDKFTEAVNIRIAQKAKKNI